MIDLRALKISHKLAVVTVIPVLCVAILGAVNLFSISSLNDTQAWVSHTNKVVLLITELEKSVVDLEAGQRGFLISGEDDFLEPFNDARVDLVNQFQALRDLLQYNPSQVQRLVAVELNVSRWLDQAGLPEIELRRKVKAGSVSSDTLQLVLSEGRGKPVLDQIRSLLEDMNDQFLVVENVQAQLIVNQIAKSMVDMETGERGFLVTGRDEFLEPYRKGRRALVTQIEDLNLLLDRSFDSKRMQAAVSSIERLSIQWRTETALPEIELRDNVNRGRSTRQDIERVLLKAQEASILDAFRVKLDEINDAFVGSNNQRGQNLALSVAKAMVDQETGQRGYLITGDKKFLEPYERGSLDLKLFLSQMRLLVNNSYSIETMSRNLKVVGELAREWQDSTAIPEIEIRRKMNENHVSMKDVTSLIETDVGKSIMDDLRLGLSSIKSEERKLMAVRERASEDSSNSLKWLIVIGSLMAMALSTLISVRIVNVITVRIQRALSGVKRIAQGDYSKDLAADTLDEMGEMASAINSVLRTLKDTTQMAQRITSGDYNFTVPLQGDKDELGKAFQDMTNAWGASQKTLDDERDKLLEQDWIKSSYATLMEHVQTSSDIQLYSERLMTILAPMLDGAVGLYYQCTEAEAEAECQVQLVLLSSYAYSQRKDVSNQFSLGEGLIGQCGLEKKQIILSHVPSDYIQISSGSGASSPTQILVFPIVFESDLLGVVEIGTATVFESKHLALIDLLKTNMGVVVNNIHARKRTEVLLDKSRSQGRALKIQQEDLKAANENLEEQTRQSKASEEILKSQSEALVSSNEELEERQELLQKQKRAVEKSKSDLDLKTQELLLASKYKSEFLANMSHELRTPLNSLLILSQSLANNKAGNLTDLQMEDARIINEGGKDLLLLINDILDLSKVEAGMLDINVGLVELPTLAKNLEILFDGVAESKELDFTVEIEDGLVGEIFTDVQRAQQILKNFLSNSFKFTSSGFVKVRFHSVTRDSQLSSPHLSSDSAIGISVSDSGIGIPAEKQQAIFEAFQQEDGSTNRKYGGTGLGLTISRELARLLGAEIHLKSGKDEGSTFTLFMPKKWEEAMPNGVENGDDESGRPRLKSHITQNSDHARMIDKDKSSEIETPVSAMRDSAWLPDDRGIIRHDDSVLLIIEDDEEFARILQRIAHDNNQRVLLSDKGREGVLLACEYQPSGIILDMGLPDIDGLEVLEQLKDNLDTRSIPVHVISGADKESVSLERGASQFLVKPASESDLQAVIGEMKGVISGGVKEVLVVEDHEGSQAAIARLLESSDIHLSFARSLVQAVEHLKAKRFDCIILDLGLPDAEAPEVLKTVSVYAKKEATPVVIYTGREISDDQYKLLKEHSSSIVVKGSHSLQRLLDDVSLFLHRVDEEISPEQRKTLKMLHNHDAMLAGRRVLVVDDDMRNVFALKRLLNDLDVDVTAAENGQVALDQINAAPSDSPFELILMDIMMPIKDGYETMAEIRALPQYAATPILALTAKAMPEDRQKCLDAGASDYVTKPIDTEKLLSMLRVWLYKRSS